VGDGEQGRQGREEERIGPGQEEHPFLIQEGREEGRRRLGAAAQGGALGVRPQSGGDAEAAGLGLGRLIPLAQLVELAALLRIAGFEVPVVRVPVAVVRVAVLEVALLEVTVLEIAVQPQPELLAQPSLSPWPPSDSGPRRIARRGPNHTRGRVRFTAARRGRTPS
jgi:hypothetical protein